MSLMEEKIRIMEDKTIIIRRSEIPIFVGPNIDGYINWDRRMGAILDNYKRKYSEKFINDQSEDWKRRFYLALKKYFDDLRKEKMSVRRYKIYKEKELIMGL